MVKAIKSWEHIFFNFHTAGNKSFFFPKFGNRLFFPKNCLASSQKIKEFLPKHILFMCTTHYFFIFDILKLKLIPKWSANEIIIYHTNKLFLFPIVLLLLDPLYIDDMEPRSWEFMVQYVVSHMCVCDKFYPPDRVHQWCCQWSNVSD